MPTQSEHHSHGHAAFPWPQLVVLVAAFVYLLYGLIGLWYTGYAPVTPAQNGATMLGIELDPLRNYVHGAVGVVGLMCATRMPASRGYGWLLAVMGAAEVVLGILALVVPSLDSVGTNVPGLVVAAVTLVVGLAVALGRVQSEAPYGGLQRSTEATGRRVIDADE